MISWRAVYARLQEGRQFASYFTRNGRLPREADFDLRVFALNFDTVPGSSVAGHPGTAVGPLTQTFDNGAIIIGVGSACFAPQQAVGDADYGPSQDGGRRDLFVLNLARTDDEPVTPPTSILTATTFLAEQEANIISECLCSGGYEDVLPSDGLMVGPGQGLSVQVSSLLDVVAFPVISVGVAFHAMVPRG